MFAQQQIHGEEHHLALGKIMTTKSSATHYNTYYDTQLKIAKENVSIGKINSIRKKNKNVQNKSTN